MLGKPRAFVHFFIFIAVLCALLAIRSKGPNTAIGLLGLAFLIVGSVAAPWVLWKMWSERGKPQASTFPSQIGWLPKKWQKWMLGESDDNASTR